MPYLVSSIIWMEKKKGGGGGGGGALVLGDWLCLIRTSLENEIGGFQ